MRGGFPPGAPDFIDILRHVWPFEAPNPHFFVPVGDCTHSLLIRDYSGAAAYLSCGLKTARRRQECFGDRGIREAFSRIGRIIEDSDFDSVEDAAVERFGHADLV